MNSLIFGAIVVSLGGYSLFALIDYIKARVKNKKQKSIVNDDLKGDK